MSTRYLQDGTPRKNSDDELIDGLGVLARDLGIFGAVKSAKVCTEAALVIADYRARIDELDLAERDAALRIAHAIRYAKQNEFSNSELRSIREILQTKAVKT